MASQTRWTWVWASSRSWRWTGRPGVLQSMGWKELDMTEDWVTTAATKTGLLWEANPTDFVWTHLVALRRRLKCKEETHVDITQLLFKERQCSAGMNPSYLWHQTDLLISPSCSFIHFTLLIELSLLHWYTLLWSFNRICLSKGIWFFYLHLTACGILTSLTRDWTCAPCSGSVPDCQGSPWNLIF